MKNKELKKNKMPAYKAIAAFFKRQIEQKELCCGQLLPSIREIQKQFQVSRDTSIKALYELRQSGIIASVHGKGFYVASTDVGRQYHILLVMDTMRPFKEVFYRSFRHAIGDEATVDLHFHYHNASYFNKLIDDSVGSYTHYIIMPFFDEDITAVLETIPREQLILVDGDWPQLQGGYTSIIQPFYRQILSCLHQADSEIIRYKRFKLIIPSEFKYYTPDGIIQGYEAFCAEKKYPSIIYKSFSASEAEKGDLYLVIADNDMIAVIEECRQKKWNIGEDIGIITIDDTPIRKILLNGIATISTDFEQMGVELAEIIKQKRSGYFENRFYFEARSSL